VRKDVYGHYQLLYGLSGKWLERWSYRHARCVVAVSQQVSRELIASGVDGARVRVISNGVDTEEFRPAVVSRQALGLPEGNLVLFIGDIKTPRKNLDTLLRAMLKVRDATLVVVGNLTGSPYPRLATRLGVAERVSFLGFRRDIPQLMRAASVFVFPSRYEACSLVLLEAAASGLPVIAASTAGGVELLTAECSVLLRDPEDDVELATTLNRLLGAPGLLAEMGAASRRVALANSWHAMAQRYLQLYSDLTGELTPQAHDVAPRPSEGLRAR
jgi:glycosyltransferase involved in cell wall biosynthesis